MLAALSDEIAHRRMAPDLDVRTDVLSLLLLADSDGDQLEDDEVLDNLLTMILAGHDTTATALAWTFDLLLHHPAAMDRLRGDLAEGDRTYIAAVIKESLRLRPVVIDAGRTLREPTSLGGSPYAAGTVVTPSILLAHHRPDLYPNPMAFRPERFLECRRVGAAHVDPVRRGHPPVSRRWLRDARDGGHGPDDRPGAASSHPRDDVRTRRSAAPSR